jgi:hypothetical protein
MYVKRPLWLHILELFLEVSVNIKEGKHSVPCSQLGKEGREGVNIVFSLI